MFPAAVSAFYKLSQLRESPVIAAPYIKQPAQQYVPSSRSLKYSSGTASPAFSRLTRWDAFHQTDSALESG